MPHTLEAWLRGELCESRVDLLLRANLPRLFNVFERDEEMLVSQVKSLSWADAVKAVEYWMLHADEVGTKERKKQLVEQRSASFSKSFEGSLDVKALFDPLSGAIFNGEAKQLYDQLFEADWAKAKAIHGDKVTVDDLKRTPSQRRHDALVEMAKRSAAMAPGSRFTRPLFNVVIGRTGFENVCELAEGTVLTPDQLVPYLSEAAIERIVFDGPSRVIDLGEQRLFKGALRRVLEIRDGHCQHPSVCDVPASQCEGDHTTAYIKGGKTNQFNGKCMCGFHNRSKGSGPPDGRAA